MAGPARSDGAQGSGRGAPSWPIADCDGRAAARRRRPAHRVRGGDRRRQRQRNPRASPSAATTTIPRSEAARRRGARDGYRRLARNVRAARSRPRSSTTRSTTTRTRPRPRTTSRTAGWGPTPSRRTATPPRWPPPLPPWSASTTSPTRCTPSAARRNSAPAHVTRPLRGRRAVETPFPYGPSLCPLSTPFGVWQSSVTLIYKSEESDL